MAATLDSTTAFPETESTFYARVRLDAGPADLTELSRLVRTGVSVGNEQFQAEGHLDDIIPKPWGYEYRAYADEYFDLWALHIGPGHGTSMHVHPRKLTYLACLGGRGVTSGLSAESEVAPGTVLRIAPGAFHSTRNAGSDPLELVEVELPRNKFDLLRLRDDYKRAGMAYESESVPEPGSGMRPVPCLPNTRIREQSPDGRFRFELRPGMDIFYRRRAEDIFYIPLCLSGLVYSELEIVFRGRNFPPDPDKAYLCIARGC